MSIVHLIGWETGNLQAEPREVDSSPETGSPASGTGVSLESSIVRTGNGSLKVDAVSSQAGAWSVRVVSPNDWFRIYVRVTSRPALLARVIIGSTGNFAFNLILNPNGALGYRQGLTTLGTSSTVLTDTTKWYRVEYRMTNGTSIVVLRIDGVDQVTASPSNLVGGSTLGPNEGLPIADTYTVYFDDYAEDNTGFPGEGKCILLIPISDNARDTLWKGGVGGTTNLWNAVNNTPPIGTDTETDLTQIEHAGGAGGTTDRYDANMTTYSTAGITANDAINCVKPFIWHGEDIAPGDKLLKFNVLSNPATAETSNFNVANASSGALGTWPTGWWVTPGPPATPTFSPAIDVSVSPVMRVVRPETASRVASVCFMGIYVDYTPASAMISARPTLINQAVNRAATW